MAKSRPQLPAIILERLPEKHGIYRELLEQMLLLTVSDRRRMFAYGKFLWRLRAACVSNQDAALWDWLEATGFNRGEVLDQWPVQKIHEAIRIYERLKDFEPEIDRIPMTVQYFIARHAFDANCLPLIRQLLNDGQDLSIDNFSAGVDPRIGIGGGKDLAEHASNGRGGKLHLSSQPTQQWHDDEDDEPMPWEGNGHCRKQELLDAEPPESGGKTGAEPFPAQKPNFQNPFSGNGNGSVATQTSNHKALAKESRDNLGRVIRSIDAFLGAGGIRPNDRRQMAWFRKFDDGMQLVFEALEEWQNQ